MIKNDHDTILQELGTNLGFNLTFDDDRICELYFDNRINIFIRSEDDDGAIIISTILAEKISENINYNTILDILNASADAYVHGGNIPVIGRDEETGFIILYQICTASYLAQTKLIDTFTSFIQYYENISKNL